MLVLFVRDYPELGCGACGWGTRWVSARGRSGHARDMHEDDLRPGLVRPVRLDPAGKHGPTRGQARGKTWRRTSHGFYVPATVDSELVEQRIVEASAMVPPNGAITGWAALRWQGGAWFDGTGAAGQPLPITILLSSHDIREQPGIITCGEGTAPGNIVCVDGVKVTRPAWSVAFMMRRTTSARGGVVALDMAAYSDLVSIAEVAAVIGGQSSWTGVPQGRWCLGMGSENSWSPAEVYMRLTWAIDGGFRCPEANVPLFDSAGRHIGTPDLVDATAGVVGEYDGAHHLQRDQRVRDVHRDERFRDHGLEVVLWMAGDRRSDFLVRLSSAYRRALRRGGPRTWTIQAPPGWVSTRTVEQRRALTADQRSRFLRYRAA